MNLNRRISFRLASAALGLSACQAMSATNREGVSQNARAVPAPSAKPEEISNMYFAKGYVGHEIMFAEHEIRGPMFVSCKLPKYEGFEAPADGLCQGGLSQAEPGGDACVATAFWLGLETMPVQGFTAGYTHDIA